MEPLLVVTDRNYSSWSMRAWLCLRCLGVAFRERTIAMGEDFERQVRELSGTAKVPVLVHQDRVVWDSLAIAEYARETMAPAGGWPTEPADRARARSVVAEIHSGFPALRRQLPFNLRLRIVAPLSPTARAEVARVEQILEGAKGPFLFGSFGFADAYLVPLLLRFRSYGVACPGAYAQQLLAHPDVSEWVEVAASETRNVPKYDRVDASQVVPAEEKDLDQCETLLRALPDWFGIEQAIQDYVRDLSRNPTWVVRCQGQVRGFVCAVEHTPECAEIHVMAVDPGMHRRGLGRRLVARVEDWAREGGREFLMVKTLGPSADYEHYQRSREFYRACGFRPLTELVGLWPGNPALVLLKVL